MQVPFTSYYLGPFGIYTSPSGMADAITLLPYLGGALHQGDYVDLDTAATSQWNQRYGSNLYNGRYRFVKVSTAATAANIYFGAPAGIAAGTTVAQVVLSAAGSGGTAGTYTCSSSVSGGTMLATASVVVNASGAITSVQLLAPGAGFTSTPTFSLGEIPGIGGGASVLAQMATSPNVVTSFDSSAIALSDVRGVFLSAPTAAQISAGCWVVIQEAGWAPVKVTTATSATVGAICTATTGAAVTTTVNSGNPTAGFMGYALDLPAASTIIRCNLRLTAYCG